MRMLSLYLLLGATALVSGCTQMDNYQSKAISLIGGDNSTINAEEAAAQEKAKRSQYSLLPMPHIMSNENVIVYSLDGDVSDMQRTFASGNPADSYAHTVFDPSVEVYAVDGSSKGPSYLPEYLVPMYGTMPKESIDTLQKGSVLTTSTVYGANNTVLITKSPLAPIKRSPKKTPGRRSAPILTAYD